MHDVVHSSLLLFPRRGESVRKMFLSISFLGQHHTALNAGGKLDRVSLLASEEESLRARAVRSQEAQ